MRYCAGLWRQKPDEGSAVVGSAGLPDQRLSSSSTIWRPHGARGHASDQGARRRRVGDPGLRAGRRRPRVRLPDGVRPAPRFTGRRGRGDRLAVRALRPRSAARLRAARGRHAADQAPHRRDRGAATADRAAGQAGRRRRRALRRSPGCSASASARIPRSTRPSGQDFRTRGRRFEEQIELLRRLWAEPAVEYHGEFHDVSGVGINPRPPGGAIPIWIGTYAPRTLERIGRLGDGWVGAAGSPRGSVNARPRSRRPRGPRVATPPASASTCRSSEGASTSSSSSSMRGAARTRGSPTSRSTRWTVA